jgi:hypothetical protein
VCSERASYWNAKVSLKRRVCALGAGELIEREREPQEGSVLLHRYVPRHNY